ncbi:MAG: trifunctional transcriptional regulator/proline dehydrogenase/L-glutamate gamma-semialdehyde dehydrogenase [Proteobacteria bacterium]|nr:trifunctional transcriptional regulator/proline dehydrogenase/L-glutamate gamma-semialdehyde dehydrogenase [Pseudomonadota bacterium]
MAHIPHGAADAPMFAAFAPLLGQPSAFRGAITAAYRRPEQACLPPLLAAATAESDMAGAIERTAARLVGALRSKRSGGGVEGLIHEYSLSSQEGVALMCLAEALLRIPDLPTRGALIRDKVAQGNWQAHIGGGRSVFVNATTWGLVMTGKLTGSVNETGLGAALTRLIARCGEPVIRRGMDLAMRMMGEQFVIGETIEEALRRARRQEARGFRYSYDMLGEAAMTADDAARYFADYEVAIHAIGAASGGRGVSDGPGISIKLSALHPRYSRSQGDRVLRELLPRVAALCALAKRYDIGVNIDAEEADRLGLSLDLLERLCADPELGGWDGLGFVVQAYGKRCPYVLDFLIDLARRSGHRLMIRLVKGAYWDAEIKRAQIDGLADYPVFTRKVHTDVSFIACARKLLDARDAVFPQFATHNAQTLATVYHLAGSQFRPGDFEFQCLHGMGEPLYEEVVGADRLDRPCRIYAPVGTHETLLAYLVRRLLENGANSSFVNRVSDPRLSIADLTADPAAVAAAVPVPGTPHPSIPLPADIYGGRRNSAGLDLSDEAALGALADALQRSTAIAWRAAPPDASGGCGARPVRNPADHRDIVGEVTEIAPRSVADACATAAAAQAAWAAVPTSERAAMLQAAGDAMQERMPLLMGLIVREAGKSAPNAISEVREAIDFLRYYAERARTMLDGAEAAPLGPVACVSPWNFPLAIFTGQVAAALAAGNAVLAKPAEETPLIAAEAVRLLHDAGVPRTALQLLPGDGAIGAALTAAPEIAGVMFTGSTEVAKSIQRRLATRLSPRGRPIPFIAETGGLNAMIVDSSALAEQVVADVIASAFDSAGQRCSALRILCLQDDVADRVLAMLKGAARELRVGRPDRISVDVGPVISAEAQRSIEAHIEAMARAGFAVEGLGRQEGVAHGTFVPPTIIEIGRIGDVTREVFGPVLHVLRYRRSALDRLIAEINATGYGLTFGLHTRLDETIERITGAMEAGNLYVNRNVIGAVVGVQPFGGRGLSGTGPKAGGPLYLGRLMQQPPPLAAATGGCEAAAAAFAGWLAARGETASAAEARETADRSPLGLVQELRGPVGELNRYALRPRGRVLLLPSTAQGLFRQLAAVLATGNEAVIDGASGAWSWLRDPPMALESRVRLSDAWTNDGPFAAALIEGAQERILDAMQRIAALPGGVVPVHVADADGSYRLEWLLDEVSTSINTAAAGGNASLMAME